MTHGVLCATFHLSTALRSLAALGFNCASDEYINPPCVQTQPSPTCIPLTMLFTPLCSVIFVAQLLSAVLAVPSPFLDSVCSRSLTHSHSVAYRLSPIKAIEDRSLEARAPVIKFHLCKDINFSGDCFYLSSNQLTVLGSDSGCVNFKAEVASSIASVRVIDTWQYSVSLYE
jgi:hypothetical protein